MTIERDLDIRLKLYTDSHRAQWVAITVIEPESGERKTILQPFSPDEHPEFDCELGTEVYSWLQLWADAEFQEALYSISGATFLHIQASDDGWDYTIYEAETMKEMDGGQLDGEDLTQMEAVLQICDENGLDSTAVIQAPLSMLETLQEVSYRQTQDQLYR